MLVAIVVLTVFLYPMVPGQPAGVEQECHILRTLEILETRLQEQDARLKLHETVLGQQKAHAEKQETRIHELESQVIASKHSAYDQRIGFTVRNPVDAAKSGVLRFTTVVTNDDGGYNTSTGEFICSMAGMYSFSLHLIKSRSSSAKYVQCRIYKNDVDVAFAYSHPHSTAVYGYYSASTSAVVHLSPGDVVHTGYCSAASSMYKYSSFSGFLIRADVLV